LQYYGAAKLPFYCQKGKALSIFDRSLLKNHLFISISENQSVENPSLCRQPVDSHQNPPYNKHMNNYSYERMFL
jgi:hypothetical protein